jgi:SAM-dependent methyltransferase
LHEAAVIVETVAALEPKAVLDLGCGTGKYGFLVRERLDYSQQGNGVRIEGVEGYASYLGPVHDLIYDRVVVSDVCEFLAGAQAGSYDVALCLDVIEHLTPEGGAALIQDALRVATTLIISTPRGYYRQDGHENELERHLSWWPPEALMAAAPDAWCAIRRDRFATVAALSRQSEPVIVANSQFRDVVVYARSLVVPEILWAKVRGKAGPRVCD